MGFNRTRRALLATLGWTFAASACGQKDTDPDAALKRKFRGIGGVVLWVSAVPEIRNAKVTDENGRAIMSPSVLGSGGGSLSFFGPSLPIPKTIRVVWREGAGWDSAKQVWNEGTVIGDYTIPVAERIPDEVLDAVRKNKAALRIKIRATDHGVLLGWDLEQSVPIPGKDYTNCRQRNDCVGALERHTAGGDFKEARIYNGKVAEPGWVVGPDGRKVETVR